MLSINDILKIELERRQKLNPAYSLRAFARYLETSPATLTQVIAGKRKLGRKTAEKVVLKLNLSPQEENQILGSLNRDTSNSSAPLERNQLSEEVFAAISNWYHLAIISLGELEVHSADPRWIARKLDIKVKDANTALMRLETLGYIKIENNRIIPTTPPISTTDEISSASVRNYHHQILDLAHLKLDEVELEKREFSSVTMAIHKKNLPKAKALIKKFKRELSNLLEHGEKDDLYNFSIQLFPLSRDIE